MSVPESLASLRVEPPIAAPVAAPARKDRRRAGPKSRWRRRSRFVALILCDQLALLSAVVGASLTLEWFFPGRPWPDWTRLLAVLAPAELLTFATHDLYRALSGDPGAELRRITLASCTLFGLPLLVSLIDGRLGTWSGALLATWFLCLFLVPTLRSIARHLRSYVPWMRQRVLVLGDGAEGRSICYWLRQRSELGLVPIGPLGDSFSLEDVKKLAHEQGALHLVLTPSASPDLARRLSASPNGFEHVTIVPSLAAFAPAHADRRAIGSTWGVSFSPPLADPWTQGLKRAIDLALGVPLFLAALPVLCVLALCIKVVSPGPALFRHRRIGRGGREFDVFKLRSMCPDAKERLERHLAQDPEARREWQRHYKLENDPRLLPGIGPLLRKTSLDELPQLLNVLRGEMSLVGPRPLPPYQIEALPRDFGERRHRVRPGLTGLWQVSERANGDMEALVQLDDTYLHNWSIWLDLGILARTGWAVLSGRGAV